VPILADERKHRKRHRHSHGVHLAMPPTWSGGEFDLPLRQVVAKTVDSYLCSSAPQDGKADPMGKCCYALQGKCCKRGGQYRSSARKAALPGLGPRPKTSAYRCREVLREG
jgi:hypothetical protein